MLRPRVIPTIILERSGAVKTRQFTQGRYLGDPTNIARIFTQHAVDELFVIDRGASRMEYPIQFDLLGRIADQCSMPLAYGGGVQHLDDAGRILRAGYEKIVVNTARFRDSDLLRSLAGRFGRQAVVAAIDIESSVGGDFVMVSRDPAGRRVGDIADFAKELELEGAGELLLTSIPREGSWSGFDLSAVRLVARSVTVPIIVQGGAGSPHHWSQAFESGASGVAVGSMFSFARRDSGVIVHMPR